MKPIEIGCLVVVLYSESAKSNEGKTGTVRDKDMSDDGAVIWAVEASSGEFMYVSGPERILYFETQKLMRVDGDVEEESDCDEVSKIKEKEVDYH